MGVYKFRITRNIFLAIFVFAIVLILAFFAALILSHNGSPATMTAACTSPGVSCNPAPRIDIVSEHLSGEPNASLDIAVQAENPNAYPEFLYVYISNSNFSIASTRLSASDWQSMKNSTAQIKAIVPESAGEIVNGNVYPVRVDGCSVDSNGVQYCVYSEINVTAV
jgi:hypothetical protein